MCLCPTLSEVKSGVDIGDGSSVDTVNRVLLSWGHVVCDAAVTTSVHSGWFKFRSVTSFLAAKGVSLLMRGKVYDACDVCMELYSTWK